jgi:hypothetical protein
MGQTLKFNRSSCNENKIERHFYQIWVGMRARCRETKDRNNKYYFGKGIRVCQEWQEFDSFFLDMWASYISHLEKCGKDTYIDRINGDEGYSKDNCRWVTASENMMNRKNAKIINGKSFKEWEKITGIKEMTLRMRYGKYGWTVDEVLFTKTGNNHGRNKINNK